MGEAARAHVDAIRTSEATAKGYEGAIDETLAAGPGPRPQGRCAIWGKALADLGADEDDLREG